MSNLSTEEKLLQAKTILSQLGGNKFLAMTGCKNLTYSDTGLSMKLTRNKSQATHLTIDVTSMDLYTVKFTRCGLNLTPMIQEVEVFENVYDDMLAPIFTQVTGLYTKF